MMQGYMSVMEAAAELGVNRFRIVQLINAGVLDAERVGRSYAVTVESVERRKVENPGAGRPRKNAVE